MEAASGRASFWYATTTFIATVIGVGIFGLPYVASRAGIGIFLLELAVLAIVMHVVNLLYAEVVWKTPGRQRFLGYVEHYLGLRWRHVLAPVTIGSFYGALLAYLIVGGAFLHNLLGQSLGGAPATYTLFLFVIGTLAVWRGLGTVKRTDLIIVAVVAALMLLFVALGLPKLQGSNLNFAGPASFLLPYGAILFALTGQSIIPELRDLVVEPHRFRRVLATGAVVIALLYGLFTVAVVGVSGGGTTTEAIQGLRGALGNRIVTLGSIIGVITIFGAFTSLGVSLKRIFSFDYRVRYPFSTVLTVFPPLVLFWLGLQNFISVINFIGAVFLGILILTTFALYRKSRQHEEHSGLLKHHPGRWVVDGLIVLFLIGIIIGIVNAMG